MILLGTAFSWKVRRNVGLGDTVANVRQQGDVFSREVEKQPVTRAVVEYQLTAAGLTQRHFSIISFSSSSLMGTHRAAGLLLVPTDISLLPLTTVLACTTKIYHSTIRGHFTSFLLSVFFLDRGGCLYILPLPLMCTCFSKVPLLLNTQSDKQTQSRRRKKPFNVFSLSSLLSVGNKNTDPLM